ncbi:MAG: hypothetical protein HQ559_00500, partial [Lentisphaerae bacterium]|nr:hypothetical protein [Lentisphaerota bacterium]
ASIGQVHVHEVLGNTLKLVGEEVRKNRVQLIESLDAPNDVIRGDAGLLGQAFLNFCLNALEAMDEGGTITVSTNEASPGIGAGQGDGNAASWIEVSVQDTGTGIVHEDLDRIFDPFFTTKSGGTGLGLSVAHGIIQEHGATVEVDSQIGRGTTFCSMFPLVPEGDVRL